MRGPSRLVSVVCALVLGMPLLAGCGRRDAGVQPITLEVQMFSGPEYRAMLPTAGYWNKKYAAQTGITVRVTELDRVGYFGKLETQIAGGLPAPDIVHPYSLHLTKIRPYLEPLGPYLERSDIMTSPDGQRLSLAEMVPKALATVVSSDGEIFMIPKDMSEVILYYRKDIIPSPPETWEDFVTLAKKFTKSLNRKSPTQYGAVLQGKYEIWTFCAALENIWAYGGEIFKEGTTVPALDNPQTIRALKVFEDLAKVGAIPEDSVDAEHPEVARLILSGKVAMAIQWSAFYKEAFGDARQDPEIYGKFDIAPPPGVRQKDGRINRAMYVQTIGLAINRNSAHKDAAARFLMWAALGEGARIYADAGGSSPLKSVWNAGMPYSRLGPWVEAFGRSVAAHQDIPELMMIGASWIQQVIAGNVSAEQAARGLNQEIREHVNQGAVGRP